MSISPPLVAKSNVIASFLLLKSLLAKAESLSLPWLGSLTKALGRGLQLIHVSKKTYMWMPSIVSSGFIYGDVGGSHLADKYRDAEIFVMNTRTRSEIFSSSRSTGLEWAAYRASGQ